MGNDPKVEAPVKRRPGRPLGSKTKPPEKVGLGKGKLREALADSLTQKDVDKLDAKVKADLLVRMEPKMKEEVTATTFRLVVEGLNRACPKCGFKPQPAPCAKCGHLETQPEAPQSTISSPAASVTDLSGAPKPYIPDEGALKRLEAAPAPSGDDWPDDGFPDA